MNKFMRATKLYIKAALNPFSIGFGLFMMIGITIAFVVETEPVGSEEYVSMLCAVGMGHIGLYFMLMFSGIGCSQNKFYISSSCAKTLFTVVPVAVSSAICIIYDTLQAVIAAINLGSMGISDVLIFNSVYGMIMICAAVSLGKKHLEWVFGIPYMFSMTFQIWISDIESLKNGFGLSVGTGLAIAVGIYAIGIAVSLIMVNMWWKKGDRFSMPNKFIANVTGG